jgi:hypothetical protein
MWFLMQTMPSGRPNNLAGADIRLEMDVYIIDSANAQSGTSQAGSFGCVVDHGGMIIVSEGVLLLS